MARRVSVPAADELFRRTGVEGDEATGKPSRAQRGTVRAVPDQPEPEVVEEAPAGRRKPSGRIKHDEKVTVYVTSGELLQLEHARLSLRGEHGLAVDRGRLIREALSLVLTDLEQHGAESALVRRLTDET